VPPLEDSPLLEDAHAHVPATRAKGGREQRNKDGRTNDRKGRNSAVDPPGTPEYSPGTPAVHP